MKNMISRERFSVKHLTIIIAICLLSRPCIAGDAAQAQSASVTVQVLSGTANGTTVEGDEVTLQVYRHKQLLQTLTGKADKTGKVVFKEVSCGEHIVGLVSAIHSNMNFGGRPVAINEGVKDVSASVEVFDVSYDQSKLSIHTHHLTVKAQQDSLLVTEYFQLVNSSDMAVSSQQEDNKKKSIVLKIMLPKGFKNFSTSSYFEEQALEFTGDGFYDTMAVPPGEHLVTFSYTLDTDSDALDIVRRLSLPTSNVVIFADTGKTACNVKIEGLGAPRTMTGNQGAKMEYYTLSNLAADTEISFKITGLNKSGASGLASWVILAIVFCAISIFAVLKLRPGKTPQKS